MITFLDNEMPVEEGKTFKVGIFGVKRGMLLLTNIRLLFLDQKYNLTEWGTAINIKDIFEISKAVSCFTSLPLPIPCCIEIRTQDGKAHKFYVSNRTKWIEAIRAQMARHEIH